MIVLKSIRNGYVAYLNSLHNISANGANALAESQALNQYFPDLYEPLPIVEHVAGLLDESEQRVVILTGHAGDGKSTVALDVFKRLKGIPPEEKLTSPLREREEIALINIVKDMSELSADQRLKWIAESFQEDGSWLIVSNTGPLLSSLMAYAENQQINDVESRILAALDQPLESESTEVHRINCFGKELVILNLTRLDNIQIGAKLLRRLVCHNAWNTCKDCSAFDTCPIKTNRSALYESIETVEERVRWLYSRLSAYEHRLTLRQIIAQLAFGITGGKSCEQIQQNNLGQIDALGEIVFSESFFGMVSGKICPKAEGIHAISLMRKEHYGSPAGVEFDRDLCSRSGMTWGELSACLKDLQVKWSEQAEDAETGIRWRYALRRMAYIFSKEIPGEKNAPVFFDTFLKSSSVRDFDRWRAEGCISLQRRELKQLTESCLSVLLEFFTGFSANQYRDNELLYLTLRRKDKAVVQPTQLVIHTIPFREFTLKYDSQKKLPKLVFRNGKAELLLSLPLMDYIRARSRGEIGSALSPIYQSQIDWFHSDLMRATQSDREDFDDTVSLIKAAINGAVTEHKFVLENGFLEVDA